MIKYIFWGLLLLTVVETIAQPTLDRRMVITIDDLPVISKIRTIEHQEAVTQKLLTTLQKDSVPAIGFVNEGKLWNKGKLQPRRVQLLKNWLEAGMELGNHAHSHKDYHRVSFEEFSEDIIKGELTTGKLLAEQGKSLKYFRHPFLHTGETPEKKALLEEFLQHRDYIVAPVTHDNSEWIFAAAYDNALLKKDSLTMAKIGGAYVDYMDAKIVYFEKQSVGLFEYELPQILLIHANTLNADYLDELLERFSQRGYRFITLAEALEDPAYDSPNTFTGMGGITWLHRWALTRNVDKTFFQGEPHTPEFVQKIAGIQE